MKDSTHYLRPCFRSLFSFNWKFGLTLILLLGIPRFVIVLSAAVSRNSGLVSIIFVIMWFMPLLLLTKEGRRRIGIRAPKSYGWLFGSILLGGAVCVITFLCFQLYYGDSLQNAFVYMSGNYPVGETAMTPSTRFTYFLIGTMASISFSPLGEELFYRGIVHESFVSRFGEQRASTFDSLAFALTHIAHFGIVYVAGAWQVFCLPALLWVIAMFVTSKVFFLCKQRSGSIWGAVLSHIGFNTMMMYITYYFVLG